MSDQVETSSDSADPLSADGRALHLRRLLLCALVVSVLVAGGYLLGDELSLSRLADREHQFREFQGEHPLLVYVAAFSAYVVVTGLSLPGAAALTLLMGWLFGFWRGVILVSFASTLGATIAFLLSRYLLRDSIQSKFGDRLRRFNEALEREGAFYLFTLRLIPVVPFFVINVVMGLTRIRLGTFWWVSQIGMLAGTCAYVYAGSTVPNLQTLAERGTREILSPRLVIAFTVLGLFPLLARRAVQRFRPQPVHIPDDRSVNSAHTTRPSIDRSPRE